MKLLFTLLFSWNVCYSQPFPDTGFCRRLHSFVDSSMYEGRETYIVTIEFSINPTLIYRAEGEKNLKECANLIRNTRWLNYTANTRYTIDLLFSYNNSCAMIARGNKQNWKSIYHICK